MARSKSNAVAPDVAADAAAPGDGVSDVAAVESSPGVISSPGDGVISAPPDGVISSKPDGVE